MDEFVTPKQVARALGVSESSVKRWCDQQVIASQRTAGGHRRLAVSAVIQYVRSAGHQLVVPAALGLSPTSGHGEQVIARGRSRFRDALLAGEEGVCRQIAIDLYLARQPLAAICDQVISTAFAEIGDLWSCQLAEVYQERRACQIAQRVLYDLRRVLPAPSLPLTAVGGTLEEDTYSLPTAMVELVLRDLGWSATSLGTALPSASLAQAIEQLNPHIVWLSVSHVTDCDRLCADIQRLNQVAAAQGAKFVVGGRAIDASLRERLAHVTFCHDVRGLENLGNQWKTAAIAGRC